MGKQASGRRSGREHAARVASGPTHVDDSHEGKGAGLAFERIVFFSDAVFAIAITLLALDIRVEQLPDSMIDRELPLKLVALWPQLLAYIVGFAVIATFWVAHHTIFTHINRYDRWLIWLNLLFLFMVAISPFPSSIVGQYGFHQLAQIFYAVSVALTGFVKIWLWHYASHDHRLIDPHLPDEEIRKVTWLGLTTPVIFLLSIPFAFVNYWIPIAIWCLSPVLYGAIARRA